MTTKIDDANASMESVFNVLASKGIEIPDGANIGDIADLIGSVETEPALQVKTGTVTVKFVSPSNVSLLLDPWCTRLIDGEIVTDAFNVTEQDGGVYSFGSVEFTIPDVIEGSLVVIFGEMTAHNTSVVNNKDYIDECYPAYSSYIKAFYYKTGDAIVTITADM